MEKIYSVYGLKEAYEAKYPNRHFFDKETLKFFGERMSEMRISKGTKVITDIDGNKIECYELSSLQRNHPLGARRVYHYFDVNTLRAITLT